MPAHTPPPQDRILSAAVRCFVRAGPAATSLQDVAEAAGVSKALIHYHFQDRDALLARTVAHLAGRIVERESRALRDVEPAQAMDALWAWVSGEIECGEIRVLLETGQDSGARVRESARDAAVLRRASSTATIERLFELFGSRPRVPSPLLGDAAVAFVDGLALDASRRGGDPAAAHVVFDVFWLAVLNLTD